MCVLQSAELYCVGVCVCVELKTLGFASPHAGVCFFFLILFSLCQENICVSYSCVFTGTQMLCVSIAILPREATHLELKYYHKLLGVSDGYRCG